MYYLGICCLILTVTCSNGQTEPMIVDRSVQCHSNEMRVYFEFRTPFTGVVYTDKYYRSPSCRWEGDGAKKLVAAVPINADSTKQPYCGVQMREENGECTVTLLISPIRGLLVDGMEGLTVRCLYQIGDVTLTLPGQSIGGSGILMKHLGAEQNQIGVVTGSGGSPFLQMTVRENHVNGGEGEIIQAAEVGQPITLDISMRDTAVYDFRVHDCYAHDGSNAPEATIGIIDGNGCAMPLSRAVGTEVRTNRAEGTGAKHVFVHMWGFQFATSQLVFFECQVKPCLQTCDLPQCTRGFNKKAADAEARRKRDDNSRSPKSVVSLTQLAKNSAKHDYNLTTVLKIRNKRLQALMPVAQDGSIAFDQQAEVTAAVPELCIQMDVAIGVLVIFLVVCVVSLAIAVYMCWRAKHGDSKARHLTYYAGSSMQSTSSGASVTNTDADDIQTISPSPKAYSRRLGSHIRYSDNVSPH